MAGAIRAQYDAIGILGGTFDPIHEGHLTIADHVLKSFQLTRIEFIPCFQPPHRHQPIASPHNRLEMVKLAVKNHPSFFVNDIEIKQQEISYTVNTLLALQKENPTACYYLIVGADAFAQFNTWHDWEKIIALTDIIVVSRDDEIIKTPKPVTDFIKNNPSKKQIHFLTITPILVSATQIRTDVRAKKEKINGLPRSVHDYILKQRVY